MEFSLINSTSLDFEYVKTILYRTLLRCHKPSLKLLQLDFS
jgi:hypothetical protein